MKTFSLLCMLLGFAFMPLFASVSHSGKIDLPSIDNTLSKLQGQTFYLGTDSAENGKLLKLYFKNTFRVPSPCTGKAPATVEHFTLAQLKNPNIVIKHLLAQAHRFAHFLDTGIEHLYSEKAATEN